MDYIYFNSHAELIRLPIADIVYFEADGNYTKVVTANKLSTTVGMNLSLMEKALARQLGPAAASFIRLGKRFIVNRTFIFKINIRTQRLVLSDFTRFALSLPVSKEALRSLKQLYVPAEKKEP